MHLEDGGSAAGLAAGAGSPATRTLVIRAEGLSDTNRFIQSVTLNGRNYPYSSLHHADLASGGLLVLKMGPKPTSWGRELAP